jgi:hypothetical protein
MPLNFPSTPSTNDTYSFNGKTWTYNGSAWDLTSTTLTTSAVSEGSNLYFSNARVIAALVEGSGINIDANGLVSSTVTGGGASGYPNSSTSTFASGNTDFMTSETYVGQTSSQDAFGVGLVTVFSLMDPIGSVVSVDLGTL